jgi:UDP-N-acetylglucosamine transferase subunit ALG13
VSVGTDHHPFDRLVSWMNHWAVSRGLVAQVLVQRGTSEEASDVMSMPYLTVEELRSALEQSAIVVCHGGPSTISQARRSGVVPIVVPRRPDLGEHVDDHQILFANRLADAGEVCLVMTEAELHVALDSYVLEPRTASEESSRHVKDTVRRIADIADHLVRSL